MSIHTVGDSHSNFGWPVDTIKHWLGPVLCYSFGEENLKKCDIRDFGLKENDVIIFCFGEIDCRCHVNKHVTENTSYESIIDNIIDNYIKSIKINLEAIQIKIKVCVYNVVPPVQKNNTSENSDYPFLGSDEERKSYILYFNKKLKFKCDENGFIFFDIYNHYIDENGFLKKEMSDGVVHISDGTHLNNFIIKNQL